MIPLGVLGGAHHAAAGGGGSLTLAYGAFLANPANTATYTFANMNIGAATATRHVVAVIAVRSTSAITSPSVTIGGTPATIDAHVGGAESENGGYSAIIVARAAVPIGTTATVVCTLSNSAVRAGCATYMLRGATPVVAGLATSTTRGNVTLTPAPVTSDALIAGVHPSQTYAASITNVTTNTDVVLESATRFVTGMATDAPVSVEVSTPSTGANWFPPSFAIAYEPA